MYRHLYGLTEKPFQISTDPAFLWLGGKHKEALAVLVYGVRDSRGFLLLSGGVGTGKTTLIRSLLGQLDKKVVVATVQDPGLTPMEFFNFIAAAYGMRRHYTNKVDFLFDFEKFLRRTRAAGRNALLIVDEAQRLDQPLLEEIRLLSNIEDPDQKLLNVFFVGQEEFLDIIASPENRALKQRITINYRLKTLNPEETEQLVRHRLKVAGATHEVFTPDAFPLIYQFSQGAPRLINILCDHALLTGFVKDTATIGAEIITECIEDLMLPGERSGSIPAPPPEAAEASRPVAATVTAGMMLQNKPPPARRAKWPWAAAAGLLLSIAVGLAAQQGWLPRGASRLTAQATPSADGNPSLPERAPATELGMTRMKTDGAAQAESGSELPEVAPEAQPRIGTATDSARSPREKKALFASGPTRSEDMDQAGTQEAAPQPKATLERARLEEHPGKTLLIGHEVPDPLPPAPVDVEQPAGGAAETEAEAKMIAAVKPQGPRPVSIEETPRNGGVGVPATGNRMNAPAMAPGASPGWKKAEAPGIVTVPAQVAKNAGNPAAGPAKAIAARTDDHLPAPSMVETSAKASAASPPSPLRALENPAATGTAILPLPSAAEGSQAEPPATSSGLAYSTEERLQDFINAYARAYESRDLKRFRLFFTEDAVENGRPFSKVLPVYQKNFAALAGLEYTIDLMSWEKEDATGRITLSGLFDVRYHIPNQDWHTTRGKITMDLVSNGGLYRVKRLEYSKKSD